MASHLKICAGISYPRRGVFLLRLLRRFLPRRADLLRLFSSRAMLRKARKAVMSKQPELLYISLDAMFFPLLYHAEAAFRRLRGVLSCVLIQTALRFGTRVSPAIYLCSLSPVCLRRSLARSSGRWGVSAPAKPIQPGDEAGLFGKSWWAMAEVVLSDRVFCFQAAHAPPGLNCYRVWRRSAP